jgi:soluble lytic murein transglycosylase-like protein
MRKTVRTVSLLVLLTAVLSAAAPGVLRVRIHSGDTLSELAQRHHTTVARLKALNHLRDDRIYAGDILRLPGNAAPAPRAATTRTSARAYLVRSGDNLTVLAKRWGTTPKALRARNHLRGSTIWIGQRLTYAVTTRVVAAPARGVSASAAHHRAVLRARALPSKATVRQLIRMAAKRYGVPPSLALAVAYQESGFQQRVVSPVDAIGVMQVLPSTGRSLGRMHGRHFDLLRASDNIEAGVVLLRDLLRATGRVPAALAGYYQGLGSVRRVGLLPQTRRYITNVQLLQKRFA